MRKRWLVPLLFGLAALAFWLGAIFCMRQLMPYEGCVSVRLPDTHVSEQMLRKALIEDENVSLKAAWTRMCAQNAAAGSMQTETQLSAVRVYGDMRQTAPMTLLYGSFPVENDRDGCVLSSDSAMALFRSVDAVGAELTIGGSTYTVRGIISGAEPQVLLRGDETTRYENLEFATGDLSTGKTTIEAFLYRFSLSDDSVSVQSGLYARLLQSAALVPWIVLACALLGKLLRGMRSVQSMLGPLLWRIALAAVLIAALVLLLRQFYWPQSFLPTRLSDFSYWRTLLESWAKDWAAISLSTPLPKDVLFFRIIRESLFLLFSSFLSILGFLGARRA